MTDDKQFETHTVDKVEVYQEGWVLTFDDSFSLFCTSDECKTAPEVGEIARLYGRGLGYPVRGIVVGERRYRYKTEAEEAADHTEWCRQLDIRRAEEKAAHEAEIAMGGHAPMAFAIKLDARADWEEGLAKNTDPYGRRCYTYAADWAAAMEKELATGKGVADVAKACSREADIDGITGFMYGVAVGLLAHVWERGEELRQWHNLDTQLGTEGEKANASGRVLNPALMSIGGRP